MPEAKPGKRRAAAAAAEGSNEVEEAKAGLPDGPMTPEQPVSTAASPSQCSAVRSCLALLPRLWSASCW